MILRVGQERIGMFLAFEYDTGGLLGLVFSRKSNKPTDWGSKEAWPNCNGICSFLGGFDE
jgi:hypothetical protein